jgi:steroid 5-alpha reductase family enzyme
MNDASHLFWRLDLAVLVFMAVVMICAWSFGLARRNGGWTDVFWTFGSGIALAGAALAPFGSVLPQARQWLVAGLVAAWALRLGSYIAGRVARHDEDPRYAQFRRDWGKAYARNMLFVVLPQAPATALLALSVLVAAQRPTPGLDLRDAAGVAVFAAAILGESLADRQMARFKADPANKGRVADTGLWGWSRHPNYFFEWLLWLAWPVMALDPARPMSWLSLVAPAVMFILLTKVSGIPPLEAAQLKSKGDAYRAYQRRVSAFFPMPPKGRPTA